jgi:hypothetical protein
MNFELTEFYCIVDLTAVQLTFYQLNPYSLTLNVHNSVNHLATCWYPIFPQSRLINNLPQFGHSSLDTLCEDRLNDVSSTKGSAYICLKFQSPILQGDPVDRNSPIWLQFCSVAMDPP